MALITVTYQLNVIEIKPDATLKQQKELIENMLYENVDIGFSEKADLILSEIDMSEDWL